MATNTIFPFSVQDVDMYILYKMDANSLVNMSGVNKLANAVLDNDRIFKPFFSACYPHLEGFKDKLFVILCKWHPTCCWKVVCSAFANNKFNVSTSFCKVTTPQIREVLETKIGEKQAELKKICGSRHEDPDSPIDKAWKAYDLVNQDLIQRSCHLNEIVKPYRRFGGISSQVMRAWVSYILTNESQVRAFLLEVGPEATVSFNRELSLTLTRDQYENVMSSVLKIFDHLGPQNSSISIKKDSLCIDSDENIKLLMAYYKLERSRETSANQLDRYKKQLECLELPIESLSETQAIIHPVMRQMWELRSELCHSLTLHNGINDDRLLSQCLEEIDNYLVVNAQDVNSLKKIQSLINTSSQSAEIWKGLWLEKGKNDEGGYIIEDCWAEKHFHEFLPALRKIVYQCREHAIWEKRYGEGSLGDAKYLQD